MTVNLKRYALWFIGTAIGLAIIAALLDSLLGMDLPNGAASVIPTMIAAMVEGQKHAEATRDPVPSPWKQAGAMTLVGAAISLVLSIPAVLAFPEILDMVSDFAVLMVGFLAVLILITWVVNRFFLTMGAKNQWKAIDRKSGS